MKPKPFCQSKGGGGIYTQTPNQHKNMEPKPAFYDDGLLYAAAQYYLFLGGVEPKTACERLAGYKAPDGLVRELWGAMYARAKTILPENFEDITEGQLGALYGVIDDVYYGGRLLKGCPITKADAGICEGTHFIQEKDTTDAGTCQYFPSQNCMRLTMTPEIFLRIPQSRTRVANGLECTTRLMCIMNVMQHETIHALMNLECLEKKTYSDKTVYEDYTSHGPVFMAIANTLFGQTKSYHCLNRLSKDEKTEIHAAQAAADAAAKAARARETILKVVLKRELATGVFAQMWPVLQHQGMTEFADWADETDQSYFSRRYLDNKAVVATILGVVARHNELMQFLAQVVPPLTTLATATVMETEHVYTADTLREVFNMHITKKPAFVKEWQDNGLDPGVAQDLFEHFTTEAAMQAFLYQLGCFDKGRDEKAKAVQAAAIIVAKGFKSVDELGELFEHMHPNHPPFAGWGLPKRVVDKVTAYYAASDEVTQLQRLLKQRLDPAEFAQCWAILEQNFMTEIHRYKDETIKGILSMHSSTNTMTQGMAETIMSIVTDQLELSYFLENTIGQPSEMADVFMASMAKEYFASVESLQDLWTSTKSDVPFYTQEMRELGFPNAVSRKIFAHFEKASTAPSMRTTWIIEYEGEPVQFIYQGDIGAFVAGVRECFGLNAGLNYELRTNRGVDAYATVVTVNLNDRDAADHQTLSRERIEDNQALLYAKLSKHLTLRPVL